MLRAVVRSCVRASDKQREAAMLRPELTCLDYASHIPSLSLSLKIVEIQRINKAEASSGVEGSWHDEFAHSAYIYIGRLQHPFLHLFHIYFPCTSVTLKTRLHWIG